MPRNYYVILGVDESATLEQIRSAYRRLAKRLHPDTSGIDSSRRFQEIQEAWQTLGDARLRRMYDNQLHPKNPPTPPHSGQPACRNSPQNSKQPRGSSIEEEAGSILHLTLRLTIGEASRGGQFPLELPVVELCQACHGAFALFGLSCPNCQGTGIALRLESYLVRIPPGVQTGDVLPVPLDLPGLFHAGLWIEVQVI